MATATRKKKSLPPDVGAAPVPIPEWRLPPGTSREVPWDGSPFTATTLAVDTETVVEYLADGSPRPLSEHTPRLVLMAVSDGQRNVIVKLHQLADFLNHHQNKHWVFHNLAFDFWVIHDQLNSSPITRPEVFWWWCMLDAGQLHDSMLLDQLVRLARGVGDLPSDKLQGDADKLPERNLDELAKDYDGLRVDKENPYRFKFGDLLQHDDWSHPDLEGYIHYALGDVISLAQIWPNLRQKALDLAPAQREYGPLTEQIQVKAAVALRKVSLNGLHFDPARAREREREYRHQANRLIAELYRAHPTRIKFAQKGQRKAEVSQGLFCRYLTKPGKFQVADKSGLPKTSQTFLRKHLARIAKEHGFEPPKSKGKTENLISASVKDWHEYAHLDPFIQKWTELNKLSKLLGFFATLKKHAASEEIHTTYYPLLRTGRVSSRQPNTTQFPRNPRFREMFTPRRGFKLFTIDYEAVELRTLAAICEAYFGFSKLGDVIRQNIDPHAYTAALLRGVPFDEFMSWKKSDPTQFKEDRQRAKACFSGDTELLTPSGWVNIQQLYDDAPDSFDNPNEASVAQYCPHTKQISFVKPLGWLHRADSEMLEIDTSFMNQCVTPDHRLLFISKVTGKPREILASDVEEELEDCWLSVHGGYLESQPNCISPLKTRLSVMVQADGSFTPTQVRLGFTKTRKINRCRMLLQEAGVSFTETITSQGATRFTAARGDWYALTMEKSFLDWKLYDPEAFIEEIGLWDGCVKHKHASSYTNTKLQDVIVAQTILVTNGYKANLTVQVKPDHPDHLPSYHLYWYVGDRKKNPEYARSNRQVTTFKQLPGLHDSYCCAVPTTWLLTRRKGKVSVSGNCNFGIPGGLGPPKLATYARATYGVNMTEEQAATMRTRIIEEIYPEWKLYLSEDALFTLAHVLQLDPDDVRMRLYRIGTNTGMLLYCLGQCVQGTPVSKATGKPYDANFQKKLWDALYDLMLQSPRRKEFEESDTLSIIKEKKASFSLYRYFFGLKAVTLTGRIRSGCSYTASRNTLFQGLAADGAKLAIYRLIRQGFRVVAFIHDEVLVEVPEDQPEQCQEIEKILVEEMNRVLGGKVPASASGVLADCWQKG